MKNLRGQLKFKLFSGTSLKVINSKIFPQKKKQNAY